MRPVIIGHRGSPMTDVENTLYSFKRAIKDGAEWIECDVRVTKDRKLVIMHDDDLPRTTDGTGLVEDHTLAELKKVRCKNGEPIPTLREVLDLGCRTVVDVKDVPLELLLPEIKAAKASDRVMISSFDWDYIREVNKNDEVKPAFLLKPGSVYSEMEGVETEVAAVFDMKSELCMPFEEVPLKKGGFLNIYHLIMVAPEEPETSARIVKNCHERGVSINVWVINHPDDLKRCVELGVDWIITDAPGKMRGMLKSL
jgi:glycerophosphoryl diester phosphodiesterase